MTNESNEGGGKPSGRPGTEGQQKSGSSRRRTRRPRRRKPKKDAGGESTPTTQQGDAPRSRRRKSSRKRSSGQRDRGRQPQEGRPEGDEKRGGAKKNEPRRKKQTGAAQQVETPQENKPRSRRRRRKPPARGRDGAAPQEQGQQASKGDNQRDRAEGRSKRGRRGRGRGRQPRGREEAAPKRVAQKQEGFDELPSGPVEPMYLVKSDENVWNLEKDEPDYDWNERDRLTNVVRVRFMSGGLHEEFDAGHEVYARRDHVIVETDKGLQLGEVVVASRRVMKPASRLPRVIRRMTTNDKRQESRNQEQEETAFNLCQQLIGQFGLKMKLICVDYLHGGNRAIFYFTADGRVDFRQIVRELASQLHTRIEMRQVGVRDASRHIGGVGPCGKQLCCNSFLQRFAPVSIRMAKDQNLVLNPQKVSGVCGRLMCCLTYEQKGYESLRKGLPKTGKRVEVDGGRLGKVRDVDVLRQLVRVQLEDGTFEIFRAEDVAPAQGDPRRPQRERSGQQPDNRTQSGQRPDGASRSRQQSKDETNSGQEPDTTGRSEQRADNARKQR